MSYNYRQKPIKEKDLPLPPRVIKLQAAYDRAGLEYVKNRQDYKEMEFLDAVSRRPDTHHKYVVSIYRIKINRRYVVGNKQDEALIYYMQQTVQKHNNEHMQIEGIEGMWLNIDTRQNLTPSGQTAKVQVLGDVPVYEIPFSPEEVDKIIEGSEIEPTQFYVANGAQKGPDTTTGEIYTIWNKEDFKEGTFTELWDIGRYNYSSKEPILQQWRIEGEKLKKQSQNIDAIVRGSGKQR